MISTLWVTPLVSLIQKRGLDGMYTAEIGSLGFSKKKNMSVILSLTILMAHHQYVTIIF